MTFCDEHNIKHSEFLDWPIDDRSKALAFQLEKASRCALCGTAEWEWEENKRAYYPIEEFCPGCYQKSMLQETAGQVPGTTVKLVPAKSQDHAKRLVSQRRKAERERPGQGRDSQA